MRIFILIMLFNIFTAQSSPSITVTCKATYGVPLTEWAKIPDASPSSLHSLRVDVVTDLEEYYLNISWAINIDMSLYNLTGTWINTDLAEYCCGYEPPFAQVELSGLEQLWFHLLVPTLPGHTPTITAYNLPPVGSDYLKSQTVDVPHAKSTSFPSSSTLTSVAIQVSDKMTDNNVEPPCLLKITLGCLAVLVSLGICFLALYNMYGIHTNHPVTELTDVCEDPVSVLLVYPADNIVFQRAVLAFAEFLQSHGGCKVAIDLWQLGRLAELGLMRWLAEHVQFADRVMIISPQPKHYHGGPRKHHVPEASHDLFPLVLHMVASYASSPSELAKFWVVHLGKTPKGSGLPVELRSCRDFNLMQDLQKIIMHLHQKQDSKSPWLKLRSRLAYEATVTEKLRNAVQQLEAWQSSQLV
ncbi:hypothetical protein DPEC_G00000510 [Dallia pectoralis]|uniref:Uncharacterized protein n=1 Tax=Dallia pectoralis TaxID=75939 RepID=A0ACC2HII1_DALPE|nr:hypothetical protein DPEC_G00000510 [Dallia pectoralis]